MSEDRKQPMLDKLASHIFSVHWDGSNFQFTEECDQHFVCELSGEELLALSQELAQLAHAAKQSPGGVAS